MDAQRYRIKRFDAWRKRVNARLPELARRVFALRACAYPGCGFHYGMEGSLGRALSEVNNFAIEYYYGAEAAGRQAILRVCIERLFRNVARAERDAS